MKRCAEDPAKLGIAEMKKLLTSFFAVTSMAIPLMAAPVGNRVWHCGTNTQIKGDALIAEVPQGEEKTGGICDFWTLQKRAAEAIRESRPC